MIDQVKIREVLGRLGAVEAELGDPAVLSDAKRYRAALANHAFLKRLEGAFLAYEKALSDIAGGEALLDDPDFRDEAQAEIARAGEYMFRVTNDDLGMAYRRLCDLIDALSGRM